MVDDCPGDREPPRVGELERLWRRFSELQRALSAVTEGGAGGATDVARGRAEALRVEADAVLDDLKALAIDARFGVLARRLSASDPRASTAERAHQALEAVVEAVSATRGYVVTFAADLPEASVLTEHPPYVEGFGPRRAPSRALLRELLEEGRSIRVTDAGESRFSKETSVMSLELRSIVAVPLIHGERPWGALYLQRDGGDGVFEAADLGVVEAAARLLTPLLTGASSLPAEPEQLSGDLAMGGSGELPPMREIVGKSAVIRRLRAIIVRLGVSDVPVLIEGESGTGKELVARALHFAGRRAGYPFVVVNCAAIPEGLIESELFGHERGAFTGATERKQGRFEVAHLGTLFLDEVSELRYELQAKLLRVLQERTFTRVGSAHSLQVDVRVVAASNRNLRDLVAAGKFREDLFHRLSVVPIEVPALRERAEDVRVLARHFLAEHAARTGRKVEFDREVHEALARYRFPGNVRELRNLVERLATLSESARVLASELPSHVVEDRAQSMSMEKDPFRHFLREPPRTNEELKEAKRAMTGLYDRYQRRLEAGFVRALLAAHQGNVSEAARAAGMNRTLFHRKLRESEAVIDDDR